MKLLLTSAGLENKKVADFFVSILPQPPEKCSVLLVGYVQDKGERSYLESVREKLQSLGLTKITFFNLKAEQFTESEREFDVICVLGGCTYEILDRMRKTGLDDFIVREVRADRSVYLGSSASSIIAGVSIAIAGWGSEADDNDIGLTDLTGLKLTDVAIYPHFRPDLKDEVEAFRKTVDYPVIALTDGEAVFVDDSGYKLIH